ncbi:IS5 family transposase [Azospirillum sp. TSA6c]|uniref:IS5 family transposase n=1 Tax=Azospirillum sp. A23 TaxID=3160608 RepID=UPI00249573BE|nr:IS5 family transposase [Azospirillum sp. TSA6c]
MSDDQYRLIEPLIPSAKPGGRPRSTDMRRLLDALFYMVRTGCQWRHLPPPPAFPPWPTVCRDFRAFLEAGVWDALRHHLVVMLRAGRPRSNSFGRHPRHPEHQNDGKRGARGFDATKKIKGRKRHIAVDTSGFLVGVLVHAADIQDTDSAGALLTRIKRLYCWLPAIFADSIYNRMPVLLACFLLALTLIIVRRIDGGGFILVPRRWVVERFFGWLGRWRRLSKDYEERTDVAEAMGTVAAIRIMIRRLAHPKRKRLPSADF